MPRRAPRSRGNRRAPDVLLIVVLLVAGCGGDGALDAPPEPGAAGSGAGGAKDGAGGEVWFREEAARRGITFRHDSGYRGRYLFPGSVSGGAALLDVDGDGDLDAYLVQGGALDGPPAERPENRLYLNDGVGRFEEVRDGGGAGDRGYGMGVACGDYDNDGDVDLYVTNLGRNTLLRNQGEGRFVDVTEAAGVGDRGWGASAGFVDFDADGHLDLFVANYLHWTVGTELDCFTPNGEPDYCSPNHYRAPARDVLYRNRGDGTFVDVTEAAGLDRAFGNGLGVVFGDFDGDGRIDIFVANDGMPDQLWRNQGDGTFRDLAVEAGCAIDLSGRSKAGMGADAVDFDDDGDLDLLVGNLQGETDSFFHNQGGYFVDATVVAGLAAHSMRHTRFGLGFFDLDHDGVLDLFQATGRVRKVGKLWSDDPFAEPNILLRGLPEGRFEPLEPVGGTDPVLLTAGRAAAFGDLDGDLDVDVLVVNRDGPAHLLLNTAAKAGSAVVLRALDARGRDALGATITLGVGERRVRRDVRTAFSYCACNDARVHVGLGVADGVSDVRVRWVDGTLESFGDFTAGRQVDLVYGAGRRLIEDG